MLKLESTWVRSVTTDEGAHLMYTETQQWWGDPDDSTWTHTGYVVAGRHVSRSFSSGFATAYTDQQRAMLEATGWTEIKPGMEKFDVEPLTASKAKAMRVAWFERTVNQEPAA